MTDSSSPSSLGHPAFVADGSWHDHDAVIVGAGFSGLYQLHRLRDDLGLDAVVLEAGSGIGGTWFWNRYPGARCDSESHTYCYYFNRALLEEWSWSERYPGQAEILRYLNFVADRLQLRPNIQLEQRVCQAQWDDQSRCWRVETETGGKYRCRYLITAVGCLSAANMPTVAGMEEFAGEHYHTGAWPHHEISFAGKRVVVIGTGSTGIQTIPQVAQTARSLTVLQRTPNYSVPARNTPISEVFLQQVRNDADDWHRRMLESRHGHPWQAPPKQARKTPPAERQKMLEDAWQHGGLRFRETFDDILYDLESNTLMAVFIREKIAATVKDPETAAMLSPQDHPFGTKRPPIDTDYFETYNRDNVRLVDIRRDPIDQVMQNGIRLSSGVLIEADMIIWATGFDAMTGALLRMGITGRDAMPLTTAWAEGPVCYLGLAVPGFPNLFTITGPGSPSVLTNMPRSIEQHVDWISSCISHLEEAGAIAEAIPEAAAAWGRHVNEAAEETLLPMAGHSWYLGANIPGKPRVFMPYVGGLNRYRQRCDEVAANGYEGFLQLPA